MIRYEPYKIVISGNRRDDIWYELYQDDLRAKRDADRKEQERTGNKRAESSHPHPVSPGTDRLNEIERRPAVGPEAVAYEKAMQGHFRKIEQSQTGVVVLGETLSLPEDLFILPPGARDFAVSDDIELFSSAHISMTNRKDKVPPIKMEPENELSDPKDKSFIRLTPCTTLMHELAHAVRSGTLNTKVLPDPWDNQEEFFAGIVENIYRSEIGAPLRHGHGMGILPPGLSTSDGFLKDAVLKKLTAAAYKRETLAKKLGALTTMKWNPFAILAQQAAKSSAAPPAAPGKPTPVRPPARPSRDPRPDI